MSTVFVNGRIVCENETVNAPLTISDGKIKNIGDFTANETLDVVDLNGGYVLPGFIDLHVHGGGGADFMDGDEFSMETVVNTHLSHGTTTIFPTTMSCTFDELKSTVNVYRRLIESNRAKANLGGLHLEGPFISPAMCGAQRKDLVYPPKAEHISFLKENSDVIARISCAPEVNGVNKMTETLFPLGIKFSMGHTAATYEQAEVAAEKGFTSITHLYSATSGFHKVNQRVHIGVTQAAFGIDELYAELIGDTRHVPKELLKLATKLKGFDKICLVTDAMRATGTDVKESFLGRICPENRVIIEDEVAKLPDRSFYAGSVGTMDKAFRFAVNDCQFTPYDAAKLTSLNPATLMGLDDKIGSIAIGKSADLLVTDENFAIKQVFVNGKRVF